MFLLERKLEKPYAMLGKKAIHALWKKSKNEQLLSDKEAMGCLLKNLFHKRIWVSDISSIFALETITSSVHDLKKLLRGYGKFGVFWFCKLQLITRRSQVRVLLPLLRKSHSAMSGFF